MANLTELQQKISDLKQKTESGNNKVKSLDELNELKAQLDKQQQKIREALSKMNALNNPKK